MIKNKIKNNKGFVVLFAVVLSSIILSVTLGVANVTLKELNFTTSARATNNAFFAADTGAECALYYDLAQTQSFFGLPDPYGNGALTYCATNPVDLTSAGPSWTFYVFPLGALGNACAIVTVTKTTSPAGTTIVSKGYDVGGDTPDCTSTNPNRVERQIELNY